MTTALGVLNTATNNRQSINTNSPNKTSFADMWSLMELEIINKKPIPIFDTATTSAEPLVNNNVSAETDGAMLSTGKINMFISIKPNKKWRDPTVLRIVLLSFIYQ